MSDASGTKIKVTSRAEAKKLLSKAEDEALVRSVAEIEKVIKECYRGNPIQVDINVSDRVEKAIIEPAGWTVSIGSYAGGRHYIVMA